jgi:hypothetical protein
MYLEKFVDMNLSDIRKTKVNIPNAAHKALLDEYIEIVHNTQNGYRLSKVRKRRNAVRPIDRSVIEIRRKYPREIE